MSLLETDFNLFQTIVYSPEFAVFFYQLEILAQIESKFISGADGLADFGWAEFSALDLSIIDMSFIRSQITYDVHIGWITSILEGFDVSLFFVESDFYIIYTAISVQLIEWQANFFLIFESATFSWMHEIEGLTVGNNYLVDYVKEQIRILEYSSVSSTYLTALGLDVGFQNGFICQMTALLKLIVADTTSSYHLGGYSIDVFYTSFFTSMQQYFIGIISSETEFSDFSTFIADADYSVSTAILNRPETFDVSQTSLAQFVFSWAISAYNLPSMESYKDFSIEGRYDFGLLIYFIGGSQWIFEASDSYTSYQAYLANYYQTFYLELDSTIKTHDSAMIFTKMADIWKYHGARVFFAHSDALMYLYSNNLDVSLAVDIDLFALMNTFYIAYDGIYMIDMSVDADVSADFNAAFVNVYSSFDFDWTASIQTQMYSHIIQSHLYSYGLWKIDWTTVGYSTGSSAHESLDAFLSVDASWTALGETTWESDGAVYAYSIISEAGFSEYKVDYLLTYDFHGLLNFFELSRSLYAEYDSVVLAQYIMQFERLFLGYEWSYNYENQDNSAFASFGSDLETAMVLNGYEIDLSWADSMWFTYDYSTLFESIILSGYPADWSACSETCGTDAIRSKNRACRIDSHPSDTFGCVGDLAQTEFCTDNDDCIDTDFEATILTIKLSIFINMKFSLTTGLISNDMFASSMSLDYDASNYGMLLVFQSFGDADSSFGQSIAASMTSDVAGNEKVFIGLSVTGFSAVRSSGRRRRRSVPLLEGQRYRRETDNSTTTIADTTTTTVEITTTTTSAETSTTKTVPVTTTTSEKTTTSVSGTTTSATTSTSTTQFSTGTTITTTSSLSTTTTSTTTASTTTSSGELTTTSGESTTTSGTATTSGESTTTSGSTTSEATAEVSCTAIVTATMVLDKTWSSSLESSVETDFTDLVAEVKAAVEAVEFDVGASSFTSVDVTGFAQVADASRRKRRETGDVEATVDIYFTATTEVKESEAEAANKDDATFDDTVTGIEEAVQDALTAGDVDILAADVTEVESDIVLVDEEEEDFEVSATIAAEYEQTKEYPTDPTATCDDPVEIDLVDNSLEAPVGCDAAEEVSNAADDAATAINSAIADSAIATGEAAVGTKATVVDTFEIGSGTTTTSTISTTSTITTATPEITTTTNDIISTTQDKTTTSESTTTSEFTTTTNDMITTTESTTSTSKIIPSTTATTSTSSFKSTTTVHSTTTSTILSTTTTTREITTSVSITSTLLDTTTKGKFSGFRSLECMLGSFVRLF